MNGDDARHMLRAAGNAVIPTEPRGLGRAASGGIP